MAARTSSNGASRSSSIFKALWIALALVILVSCSRYYNYKRLSATPEREQRRDRVQRAKLAQQRFERAKNNRHNTVTEYGDVPNISKVPSSMANETIVMPELFNLLDMLTEWPTDDTSEESIENAKYMSIRRIDFRTEAHLIQVYRDMEIPFVMTHHPDILATSEKWTDEYLNMRYTSPSSRKNHIGHSVEVAPHNHFMYFAAKSKHPPGWTPPTSHTVMSYEEWAEAAREKDTLAEPSGSYHYFHSNGWGAENRWIVEDLALLSPVPGLLMHEDVSGHHGINCRFGMKGLTAAAHYDGKRNFIAIMRGHKRYILAPPHECPNIYLYERGHPSARHTEVEWSQYPDLEQFPLFAEAKATQVILKAGEVLYLPSFWFHHIVSLNMNLQCNGRSSKGTQFVEELEKCGFY